MICWLIISEQTHEKFTLKIIFLFVFSLWTFSFKNLNFTHSYYKEKNVRQDWKTLMNLVRIWTQMEIEKEGEIGIKARSVLWYLTFFGFAIIYISQINASIAIVGMISINLNNSTHNTTVVTSECIIESHRNFTTSAELNYEANLDEEQSKYISLERRFLDFLGVSHVTSGKQN